ncbi:hypothetical protein DFH06DRAFT_1396900 [Mycena polygramma]|nr:hypothetical protein DFH06DRAFT_1396900 [Mycena polygramma]
MRIHQVMTLAAYRLAQLNRLGPLPRVFALPRSSLQSSVGDVDHETVIYIDPPSTSRHFPALFCGTSFELLSNSPSDYYRFSLMPKAVKPRYARTPDETIALILGESAQLRLDQLEVQPPSNHEEDDVDDASQHSTDSDDSNRDHVGGGESSGYPAQESLRPNAPDTGEHWLKQGDAARHVEARTELSYITPPPSSRSDHDTPRVDALPVSRKRASTTVDLNWHPLVPGLHASRPLPVEVKDLSVLIRPEPDPYDLASIPAELSVLIGWMSAFNGMKADDLPMSSGSSGYPSAMNGKERARPDPPVLTPTHRLTASEVAARNAPDRRRDNHGLDSFRVYIITVNIRVRSSDGNTKVDMSVMAEHQDHADMLIHFKPDGGPSASVLAGAARFNSIFTKSQAVGASAEVPVLFDDLEFYKSYFDGNKPCGVFDLRLQDPMLRLHYLDLAPLPCNRRILPLGNRVQPSTDGIDWTTGGRVKYSSWFEQNPNLQPSNSLGAMTFEYAAPNFINLSRIPPFDLSSRESAGSARVSRLYFGGRVAVCVAAVCSIESHVVAPNNPGPQSDVQCKWLSGVMHDQDWERFEAIVCLVVGEQFMYGQLTDNAVTFRTRLNPDPVLAESGNAMSSVSSSVKSSFSTSQTTPKRSTRSNTNLGKTLLNHNDPIPVYDARDTVVDFASDLDRLVEVLPLFHGEVPAAGLRAGIWVHSLVSASTYCGS